jgi:hypothetical protein
MRFCYWFVSKGSAMSSSKISIIPAQGAVVFLGSRQYAVIAWQIDSLLGCVTPITVAGPVEEFDFIQIDGVKQQ